MVSTRKKKSQNNRQLSQFDETSNDFVINNGTAVITMQNEGVELQANGRREDFGGIVDSASQNQFTGGITDDRIRNAVDGAVIVVENSLHDAILTAMNSVVIPRVDMAARSVTCSSRNGPYSLVQNLDRRDFMANIENTPVKSASSFSCDFSTVVSCYQTSLFDIPFDPKPQIGQTALVLFAFEVKQTSPQLVSVKN